jgi:hypothetical protein
VGGAVTATLLRLSGVPFGFHGQPSSSRLAWHRPRRPAMPLPPPSSEERAMGRPSPTNFPGPLGTKKSSWACAWAAGTARERAWPDTKFAGPSQATRLDIYSNTTRPQYKVMRSSVQSNSFFRIRPNSKVVLILTFCTHIGF